MRKIVLALCAIAILNSCDASKKVVDASTKVTTAQQSVSKNTAEATKQSKIATKAILKKMLVGKEDRTVLEQAPFATWYTPNYKEYTPEAEALPEIKKHLEGVTITTFMGTWCGDSKRETPRMFKILDEAAFNQDQLELITVDRTKKKPLAFTKGNNILRVPTFIFKKDGKEIGRIVEHPVESLEADMLKILKEEPYKHAYEN